MKNNCLIFFCLELENGLLTRPALDKYFGLIDGLLVSRRDKTLTYTKLLTKSLKFLTNKIQSNIWD